MIKKAAAVAVMALGMACGQTGSGTTPIGEACTDTQECVPNSVCFNQFCVGQGAMRVSLGWNADSDFDLHLNTPDGEHIFFGHKMGVDGTLDVDQCINTCGTGAHVENIVFSTNAPNGTYEVWVQNFDGRAGGAFNIEVDGAVTRNFSGSLPATSFSDSQTFTFQK